MKTLTKIFDSIIMIVLLSCSSQTVDSRSKTAPLIAKDTTNENERKNTLLVFVAEKIDVVEIPYKPGDFDNGVKAKYKVLQRVYGSYDKDTIEFESYSHRGFNFIKYKNILLYVIENKGKYYQERYIFDPIFKTKDGRWAGPYSDDYGHSYNKNTTIKPQIIDFAEEVSFPTKETHYGKITELFYPEPYFKIEGDKAIAVYGNYVEELFKLKKDGILTARELFGDKKPEHIEIKLKIEDSSGKK